MSFSSAFRYPFTNFAKVFSIVLVMTIAMALFASLLFNAVDLEGYITAISAWDGTNHAELPAFSLDGSGVMGILGVLLVAIVSGLWLSGYSVSVLRALMDGEPMLPAISFGRELVDGFYLLLASLAYGILFVALVVVEAVVLGVLPGFASGIVGLAAIFLTIGVGAVMGWAYFVGMARMAADGHHRAAWQIRRNMRIARDNWRWGAFLLLYMILLTMIYGVFRSLVDSVVGGLMGAAGMTLSIILYYFFNLMQHFSTQHLIAQYAEAIGIGAGKGKIGDTVEA